MAIEQVLIVEDNHVQRQVFVKLATAAGVQPHFVVDGQEAIDAIIQNRHYAAIFMDIGLIKMDGLECTRHIRDIEFGTESRVPIIAITGRTGDEARQECFEAGMDDFLRKPVSQEQFDEKIQTWVRHPALTD
jgi:CheY-like chemotaxis protein